MNKKVSDILPKTEILAQLAEEASELAQAALKLRRALDGTNPTPKSVEECEENLIEELADIKVAFTVYLSDSKPCIKARVSEEINKTAEIKLDRWLSRLEAKENENVEYHVGCGPFGNVYAWTYAPPCKDDLQAWQSMKEVTSEAIEAVVNHFIIKMEHDGKNKIQKAWGVRGGKTLKVTFELSPGKEI